MAAELKHTQQQLVSTELALDRYYRAAIQTLLEQHASTPLAC